MTRPTWQYHPTDARRTERMRNSSRVVLTRICFSSTLKKWATHHKFRIGKRTDWVRCQLR
jgi:hypothetical protein